MKTILLYSVILFGQLAFTQEFTITPEKKLEIQEYIDHFEKNDQMMGTLSIMENGKEIVNETFGKINRKENAISSNRKYTIGSITKLYTAVLLAKLQEEEKISFDEKLTTYFPNIPNAEKIQIKHMLNHTSGLKDYVSKSDTLDFWLKEPRTQTELIDEIIAQGVLFEPGDSLAYSNSAYFLLGKILEKKYKKPYQKILADELIKPLNLKHTVALSEEQSLTTIGKSFEKKESKWTEIEEFYFPNAFSAGYIASTALDVNRFLNALFTYKIIKKETLESMLPAGKNWFGLGIMQVPFYEHKGYGHGGDTFGTHSVGMYTLKNNLALTYIINGENYPTNDFAIGLLSIIYGKEYTLPSFKDYKPDAKFFEQYSGVYSSDELPIKIKVYSKEGNLIAQGDGQSALKLKPVEKHVFDFKNAGIVLEFVPNQELMILKQAGREFVMKKDE